MRSAGRETVVDQKQRRVGDVVDRRESLFPVVGVHERPTESAGTAHIRQKDGDARLEQRREELVVARPALAFGPTVQEEHRADRLDSFWRAKQPAGERPIRRGR